MYISSYWLSYMPSKLSEKHPRGFGYIVGPILPNFNWSWAGPTGRYSENSHSINQKIQKTGFFWRFLSFVEESRQMCQTLVLENESSNLHLAYRENRISDASTVLKILPVKGVLFSTSVEVRVLIPSVVRLCPSTNSGSVREHFSRRTALRIFLIFCMNVPYYKQKKRTRPFFRENSCSLIIHENMLKNGLF